MSNIIRYMLTYIDALSAYYLKRKLPGKKMKATPFRLLQHSKKGKRKKKEKGNKPLKTISSMI